MNRAQRRNASTPKSNVRKAGLTYLTVAGVVGGTIGLASPANAAVYAPMNCNTLESDLASLATNGGTLTADFQGTCDIPTRYVFNTPTTITGPTDGSLTLRFTDSASSGFEPRNEFSLSNFSFTRQSNSGYFDHFIYGWAEPITISNSTFSNSEVVAAIYAEGNLTVSNSTFTNLTSNVGGPAIRVDSQATAEISNSTFSGNKSVDEEQGGAIRSNGALTVLNSSFNSNEAEDEGGAIYSSGPLTVANSSFDSNTADNAGGAIYAVSPETKLIKNSTFVENSADDSAAVFLSEGGLIAHNTFWNNGDVDTYSIDLDSPSITNLFGNILANDAPNNARLIDSNSDPVDLGANLYTDDSFNDTTTGAGSSELVTVADLKLSALALNQTAPSNTGVTKTVAIASDSVAKDFHSADSTGINPTNGGAISSLLPTTDQRGVARPIGAGYDVGAFEFGTTTIEETEEETLANTGLPTGAGYLALVGLGASAILSGSAGLLRRRKKV